MIHEYALQPEMVATWGELYRARFYLREFGFEQGRLVSQYPKKWTRKVWEAFDGANDNDKMRLTELLVQLKKNMIKRKNCDWDTTKDEWLSNALVEHNRYPFCVLMAKDNPENNGDVLIEEALNQPICEGWDNPHGLPVNRNAQDMANSIGVLLSHCRWVKFVDPYLCQCRHNYKLSMSTFFGSLATQEPMGQPDNIEIHTSGDGASEEFLKEFYGKILPKGLNATLFRWKEKTGGQRLHNRYILTDIGGVSFLHGLACGEEGETDDVNRLDLKQYKLRCSQYNPAAPAFDQSALPITIEGLR